MVGVLVLVPGAAVAGGRLSLQDGRTITNPGQVVVRPVFPRPVHRQFPPHHVFPFVVFPPAAYGYMPPPAVYDQPSPMVMTYPSTPTYFPTVVEYPNGRYELWGDGVLTPFRWVWIPKAPSAPPPDTPPALEPPARPEPTRDRQPAPQRDIYRWTDADGVTHWTDQLENIPERDRSKAQRTLAGK